MTNAIPQFADDVRDRVCENVKKADYFAVTTDGWTSSSTQYYIIITAHFVNQTFDFENYTLQTRILRDSHTGLNLGQVPQTAMNEC